MALWWCFVMLAVAGTSSQHLQDSTDDLSVDSDQQLPEAAQPGPGYGRRGCSVWCGCTGSVRSSRCCPYSISMCGTDPAVRQPNDVHSVRTVCRGSQCYRRGRTIGRPVYGRPWPLTPLTHRSAPCGVGVNCPHGTYYSAQDTPTQLTYRSASSAPCGADVNCRHDTYYSAQDTPTQLTYRSAASAPCGAGVNCRHGMYHSAQAPPTARAASVRCSADVNCNRYGTGDHICCNGQCRTPTACNPGGMYDLYGHYY